MPIDVAMQEPWSWVVSGPSNGHIVTLCSDSHYVATGRVDVVVIGLPGTSNNAERVSVQMEWMLICDLVSWITRITQNGDLRDRPVPCLQVLTIQQLYLLPKYKHFRQVEERSRPLFH